MNPREANRALRVAARFVQHDVLDLELGERFDVVFTSYGTVCWLEDLYRWARARSSTREPDAR